MRRESTRLVPNDLGRVFGHYELHGEPLSLHTAHHAALEALTDDREHGVPVVA